jgi:hypothetical protein
MTPRRRTYNTAELAEAANVLRQLLAEIDRPDEETLVASKTVRYRLEGALLALEAIAAKGTVTGDELLAELGIQDTVD